MRIDGFLLKNFTDCGADELDAILSWRNAPEVRRNSFSCGEIDRESHFSYVKSLPKRKDRAYFLVYDGNGPVGVISFTGMDGVSAEVGYYKAGDRKNEKGVGALLLKLAEKAACAVGGGKWRLLKTEVFSSNIPSVKSIERAGYKENREKRRQFARERDGEIVSVLCYELALTAPRKYA